MVIIMQVTLMNVFVNICYSDETTGWTPLTYAASGGHIDIVKYLLDEGADVNGKFSPEKLKCNEKTSWIVRSYSVLYIHTHIYHFDTSDQRKPQGYISHISLTTG